MYSFEVEASRIERYIYREKSVKYKARADVSNLYIFFGCENEEGCERGGKSRILMTEITIEYIKEEVYIAKEHLTSSVLHIFVTKTEKRSHRKTQFRRLFWYGRYIV